MNFITRSRNAMILLSAAAVLYGLGTLFLVVAWATFSPLLSISAINTFNDWYHAANWLHFLGGLTALAGIGAAAWETLPSRNHEQLAELAGALAATLVIAIGALVVASSSPPRRRRCPRRT